MREEREVGKVRQGEKRNYVKGLFDTNGIWREEEERADVVTDYFEQLFISGMTGFCDAVFAGVEGIVIKYMNVFFSRKYEEAEIKAVCMFFFINSSGVLWVRKL